MSIQSSINQSLAVAGAYKAMRVRATEKAAKEAERAAKAEAKAAPTAAPTAPIMQAKPYDQAKAVEALRGAMIQAQSKKALKRAVSEYIVKWREYGEK